jgi:beta-N-acetylhexosaminidase
MAPLQAGADDIARVMDRVRGAPVILVGSYNLDRNTKWRDLIRALAGENLVVVAVRSPYDLTQLPGVGTYIATYSDRPVALQALSTLLTGRNQPKGHLPVELPELYPRGWGMTTF